MVCTDPDDGIAGCIALSAARSERAWLPRRAQRNRPAPIPAILLGRLAVDRDHRKKGYAASLVQFAFATAVRLAADIGCYGVLTHPLDEELRAFYVRFGFRDLPFGPRRGMFVRIAGLEAIGFG